MNDSGNDPLEKSFRKRSINFQSSNSEIISKSYSLSPINFPAIEGLGKEEKRIIDFNINKDNISRNSEFPEIQSLTNANNTSSKLTQNLSRINNSMSPIPHSRKTQHKKYPKAPANYKDLLEKGINNLRSQYEMDAEDSFYAKEQDSLNKMRKILDTSKLNIENKKAMMSVQAMIEADYRKKAKRKILIRRYFSTDEIMEKFGKNRNKADTINNNSSKPTNTPKSKKLFKVQFHIKPPGGKNQTFDDNLEDSLGRVQIKEHLRVSKYNIQNLTEIQSKAHAYSMNNKLSILESIFVNQLNSMIRENKKVRIYTNIYIYI